MMPQWEGDLRRMGVGVGYAPGMGLFAKLGTFFESFQGTQPTVVVVAYWELTMPVTEDYLEHLTGIYNFRWELAEAPERGMRVKVPGHDGRAADGVVLRQATERDISRAREAGYTVDELKKVQRLVSPDEVDKAVSAEKREAESWLRMARRAAGLPTKGKARHNPPSGYPPIAPVDGSGDTEQLREHLHMWKQARKLAKKYDHDAEEIERFNEIVKHWQKVEREHGVRSPKR